MAPEDVAAAPASLCPPSVASTGSAVERRDQGSLINANKNNTARFGDVLPLSKLQSFTENIAAAATILLSTILLQSYRRVKATSYQKLGYKYQDRIPQFYSVSSMAGN